MFANNTQQYMPTMSLLLFTKSHFFRLISPHDMPNSIIKLGDKTRSLYRGTWQPWISHQRRIRRLLCLSHTYNEARQKQVLKDYNLIHFISHESPTYIDSIKTYRALLKRFKRVDFDEEIWKHSQGLSESFKVSQSFIILIVSAHCLRSLSLPQSLSISLFCLIVSYISGLRVCWSLSNAHCFRFLRVCW